MNNIRDVRPDLFSTVDSLLLHSQLKRQKYYDFHAVPWWVIWNQEFTSAWEEVEMCRQSLFF